MLGDGGGDRLKDLPLGQGRKDAYGISILRLLLQGGTEHLLDGPPALGKYLLSFCRESVAAAVKGGRDYLIHERLRRRTRIVGILPEGNSALILVCARLRHVAGT